MVLADPGPNLLHVIVAAIGEKVLRIRGNGEEFIAILVETFAVLSTRLPPRHWL